ncbi:DUF6907 domain-containing protein [Mycolicibacterium elephantis]|uniref:Uncharacterized protein n=1 Tax=Mycolicibacterium elephantis DSM 44368 TaxID=1335622 RepID=A0A439DPV0_9MYCO|nr:hypothetical protein [Mycolicibacterium elephantis]MCV7219853.1 hypothetical protein [Mycolicibacterium elephantis]RWA17591.1 hypothetical protein MELE44368_05445 [Mycolicibacterium elephantis DSM 44368]
MTTLRLVPRFELVPPIVCAPWCEYGDGHPNCFHRDDQSCWSESDYLELELEPVGVDVLGGPYPSRLGVAAHRPGGDAALQVYLHADLVQGGIDVGVHLTAAEARKLAAELVRAAETIEETR